MKGKVVIITGGSSGIGRALAHEFGSKGSKLLITGRRENLLIETADELRSKGIEVVTMMADVSQQKDNQQMAQLALEHFGGIDILINNAGISMRALFEEVDLEVIQKVMDINFYGSVFATKYCLPSIIERQGSVVGISSIAGYRGLPGRVGYSASKFALQGFLESLRTEMLPRKVHVLTACPGFTTSNIREASLTKDGRPQGRSPRDEEKNYLKIYEKLHLNFSHDREVLNGLYLSTSVEWAQRNPLQNTTDYTFKDRTEREYTPNFPANEELEDTSFEKHQAFLLTAEIKWQPGQKYIKRPYRKFVVKTPYPSFTLVVEAALPEVLGADLNYQRIAGKISHDFKVGLLGAGKALVEAGGFLGKDSLSFVDFKHFNGNRTVFGHFETGNFQLLDYYLYSTSKTYFQAHYEHHFNGFIFNKIPLLRKSKIQAVAVFNYLHTPELNNYWEFGMGIEHIFKILRVDYYNSWISGRHQRSGFRFGIGF